MRESDIDKKIGEYLRSLSNCRAVKHHGSAYRLGEPDWYGSLNGRMFVIETKKPGERSRRVQTAVQNQWRRAGALVIVDATCVEDVQRVLESHLSNT